MPITKCLISKTKKSNISKKKNKKAFIYATYNIRSKNITIDNLVIKEILNGKETQRSFNCNHRNSYDLALSSILHELAHAFDYKRFPNRNIEKSYLKCRRLKRKNGPKSRKSRVSNSCRQLFIKYKKKTKYSDSKEFKFLSFWKQNSLFNKNKNLNAVRSPDLYENDSPKESFAVNFEYFLLDPGYKCRRPSLYKYFAKILSYTPYESSENSCKEFNQLYLNENGIVKKYELDIERLYRIDYVLATEGSGAISGFGHSLFRFVFCAPKRVEPKTGTILRATEFGEECLNDYKYHLLFGFAADLNELTLDMIKGLTGGYESKLGVFSYASTVIQYNEVELRDLNFYPLKLNQSQKIIFLDRFKEIYWQYRGSYKFLTNNCANEGKYLLKALFKEKLDASFWDFIEKPFELRDRLISNDLIDLQKVEISKSKQRYYEKHLNRLLNIEKKDFNETLLNYISKEMSQRKMILQTRLLELNSKKLQISLYVSYIYLERLILSKASLLVSDKINLFLADEEATTSANINFELLRKIFLALTPIKYNYLGGYGIPLIEEIEIRPTQLKKPTKEIQKIMAQFALIFKDDYDLIEQIKVNINLLRIEQLKLRKSLRK